jgi:hypothetical protein
MIDARKIAQEVRANHALIDGCLLPHDFVPIEDKRRLFARKEKCGKCGGIVDFSAAMWYKRGMIDGVAASSEI